MHKKNFYILFKKYFVLLLSIIYLLNPVQKGLVETIHAFSHLLSQTQHSHHNFDHLHGYTHSHDHPVVGFFSKLFSSEEDPVTQDIPFFNYIFDKHFAQEHQKINFNLKITNKDDFFYMFHFSAVIKNTPDPPPETFFL